MKKATRILSFIICVLLTFSLIPSVQAAEKAVYVKDGGSGSGESAASPVGSLATAFSKLGTNGGTIVVCGPVSLSAKLQPSAHKGKVVITSLYGGVDYRTTANARISVNANIVLSGETEFNNLNIVATVAKSATNHFRSSSYGICTNVLS